MTIEHTRWLREKGFQTGVEFSLGQSINRGWMWNVIILNRGILNEYSNMATGDRGSSVRKVALKKSPRSWQLCHREFESRQRHTDALTWPRIPGLDLSVDGAGHEELMFGVERANVEAGGRVGLQRVQKATLLEVESVNVGTVADEVDVTVGRMVDQVTTKFRNSKSVVPAKLSVDLKSKPHYLNKKIFHDQVIDISQSQVIKQKSVDQSIDWFEIHYTSYNLLSPRLELSNVSI